VWVLLEASIKDTIRNLIAKFVWVALTNRLRSEEEMAWFVVFHVICELEDINYI
jgi:hypothetical protein